MSQNLIHPSRIHPLTGLPLRAAGVLPSGRIVWPILGGDDTVDPIERPEGVTEAEWEALGDPGKQAIARERERANAAERDLAAARARPGPTKATPVIKPAESASGEQQPDFAALIQQAVDAAVKPFADKEAQRETAKAAGLIQTAVLDAAKDRLHDATDALAGIDLTTVVGDQGVVDADKIKTAIDDLVARKPHLAKTGQRIAPPGIGGGAPATLTDADKVKAALADMQRATGVRLPPSSTTL